MIVAVNGEEIEVGEDATVAAVLEHLEIDPRRRGIAIAVDGDVVPRAGWGDCALSDGARVEVVTAIQGG